MSLQSKALGAFSGVNWYLLAAKAAVLAGLIAVAYLQGAHRCELKHSKEQTKAAQIKYVDAVHEVQVRVPVVQEVEKKSTERRANMKAIGDKLDEANQSTNAGSCSLSAEQLRQYQELAKATQH